MRALDPRNRGGLARAACDRRALAVDRPGRRGPLYEQSGTDSGRATRSRGPGRAGNEASGHLDRPGRDRHGRSPGTLRTAGRDLLRVRPLQRARASAQPRSGRRRRAGRRRPLADVERAEATRGCNGRRRSHRRVGSARRHALRLRGNTHPSSQRCDDCARLRGNTHPTPQRCDDCARLRGNTHPTPQRCDDCAASAATPTSPRSGATTAPASAATPTPPRSGATMRPPPRQHPPPLAAVRRLRPSPRAWRRRPRHPTRPRPLARRRLLTSEQKQRKAELERLIQRDQDTLKTLISDADAADLETSAELREIAQRLPGLQAALRALERGESTPTEPAR